MICDGIKPSNKGTGYVLRRLIRRVLALDPMLNTFTIIKQICEIYKSLNKQIIDSVFHEEKEKFDFTMRRGLVEIEKMDDFSAKNAFRLFESYGLPFETIKDMGGEKAKKLTREEFDEEYRKHQEQSRTMSAGMFKGGLADTSVETTKLHTTAHLMLEAMRRVLGEHVQQKGSNITSERLRFDFSHGEKVTPEQIAKIEEIVNEQIEKDLPVHFEEMSVAQAKELGATGVFEHKYGDKVKVYFVGKDGDYFSKEICGGPHVTHTGEIGHFKIIKEESASAGVRRFKAIVK